MDKSLLPSLCSSCHLHLWRSNLFPCARGGACPRRAPLHEQTPLEHVCAFSAQTVGAVASAADALLFSWTSLTVLWCGPKPIARVIKKRLEWLYGILPAFQVERPYVTMKGALEFLRFAQNALLQDLQ